MGNPCNSAARVFRMAPAILVLASGVAIHTSRAASWTEINSSLPRAAVNVNNLVFAPTTPSTLYATTWGPDGVGGMFRSTDGASTWRPISSITGVNLVVADPRTPATIYVVTSRGRLLKSTNGGESWAGAGKGLPNTYLTALAIDPVTPSTLYAVAGGPSAIFKSTNGGGDWTALNTGLPPGAFLTSLVIDPVNPSRVFATGTIPRPDGPPGGSIIRSTDGGESWTDLAAALPANSSIRSLAVTSTAPSVIYAIGPFGATGPPILKSGDGGESWTTVHTGLPSHASIRSLVVDPKDSSTIYLAVLFPMAGAGGVLKSTDGGLTWNAVNPSLPANTAVQLLAIDPVASSTIYMITEGAIFKSTDGGTKWNKVTATGLTNILVQTIVMNRLDAATLYAAAGDSVFKSLDGGANWSTLFSFQLALASVPGFFAPPFPAISPAYPRTLLIDFANPDILYAGTYRANGCFFADNLLFKTTDGGLTWTDSITPDKTGCVMGGFFGPSGGLKAMDPTDPNILYVAAVDDEDAGYWLLRSSDGGASWKTMEKYPGGGQAGVWAFVIDPSNPATIYAGLDDVPEYSFVDETVKPGLGGIFKSRDGGASWDRIGPTGAAVNLLVIDSADPKVLYAATEGNYGAPRGFRGLLKSTDSGASWSRAGNGLAVLIDTGARMTALVIDPANSNTLYAAASGAGVFKSSDGGANWSRLNDGLANLDVRTLIGAPGARHTLYAGTSGGVFKLVDDAR